MMYKRIIIFTLHVHHCSMHQSRRHRSTALLSQSRYIFSKSDSESMWVQVALDLRWLSSVLDPPRLLAYTDFRAMNTLLDTGPKFEFYCHITGTTLCFVIELIRASRRLLSLSLSLSCMATRRRMYGGLG